MEQNQIRCNTTNEGKRRRTQQPNHIGDGDDEGNRRRTQQPNRDGKEGPKNDTTKHGTTQQLQTANTLVAQNPPATAKPNRGLTQTTRTGSEVNIKADLQKG